MKMEVNKAVQPVCARFYETVCACYELLHLDLHKMDVPQRAAMDILHHVLYKDKGMQDALAELARGSQMAIAKSLKNRMDDEEGKGYVIRRLGEDGKIWGYFSDSVHGADSCGFVADAAGATVYGSMAAACEAARWLSTREPNTVFRIDPVEEGGEA